MHIRGIFSRYRYEKGAEAADEFPLQDKKPVITPPKKDTSPTLAPDEVKGTDMEPWFPTQNELKEKEWVKPQWEREKTNHVWYGFNYNDKFKDEVLMKERYFAIIVIGCFGFWFCWRYFPDKRLEEWCQREAYLRLASRESLGLPAIDPWYVPPEKVVLPTDEELGNFPIEI
ncbi:unnamed protein product [Didymodactylos carnosus]|nr:unnamed protein product [Didymodactylos carnosus]CAF3990467.1 unnamed protein product [Didymodactylos carnosus]